MYLSKFLYNFCTINLLLATLNTSFVSISICDVSKHRILNEIKIRKNVTTLQFFFFNKKILSVAVFRQKQKLYVLFFFFEKALCCSCYRCRFILSLRVTANNTKLILLFRSLCLYILFYSECKQAPWNTESILMFSQTNVDYSMLIWWSVYFALRPRQRLYECTECVLYTAATQHTYTQLIYIAEMLLFRKTTTHGSEHVNTCIPNRFTTTRLRRGGGHT